MERIIVVYGSKYGTAKRYAQWIAEQLDAQAVPENEVTKDQLLSSDVVILGGGIYASSILGAKVARKFEPILLEKELILFTVGLADPMIKEPFQPILKKNFSENLRSHAHIFHFRGGIDYQNLTFTHKAMMAMLLKMLKRKPESERSEDDRLMIQTYGEKVDFCDSKSIAPLVQLVRTKK